MAGPSAPKSSSFTDLPRVKAPDAPAPKPVATAPAQAEKPAVWTAKAAGAKPASDGFETRRSASSASLPPASLGLSPTELQALERSLVDLKEAMNDVGLAPALQQAIVDGLGQLEPRALQQELQRLAPIVSSAGQRERALATDVELAEKARANPALAARLTPQVREALLRGVCDARDDDSTSGTAGVLGRHQAVEAAETLAAMDPATAAAVQDLLAKAGKGKPGAATLTERALILKAVAARAEAFRTPEGAKAALAELTGYAAEIRGLPRAELTRTSTVIDVDDKNTSTYDPTNPAMKDTDTSNDGLYQRYESSCGPTVAQMMRAEADPIYARRLHGKGFDDPSPDSAVAKEQRESLEKSRFEDAGGNRVQLTPAQLDAWKKSGQLPPGVVDGGGAAVPRTEHAQRLVTLARQADKAGLVGPQRRAIEADLEGRPPASPQEAAERAKAWAAVRKANGGKPSDADVAALKQGARKGQGMKLQDAVHDIARPATHTDVRPRPFDLNEIGKQLKTGQPVPIYVTGPLESNPHFMLMTDVRGEAPQRVFLVSDPASGKTAWVAEADLQGATPWPKQVFGYPATQAVNAYW